MIWFKFGFNTKKKLQKENLLERCGKALVFEDDEEAKLKKIDDMEICEQSQP